MTTKPKIIIPENNIIDINEKPYKTKKEIGKLVNFFRTKQMLGTKLKKK